MDVIELASRRPAATSENRVCPCGSAWFTLDRAGDQEAAVALDHNGVIVAYTGAPRCVECGRLLTA